MRRHSANRDTVSDPRAFLMTTTRICLDLLMSARARRKVAAALNVLDGADRVAHFLVGAARKGWREEFTLRFAAVNGLPAVIVDGPDGPVQTSAFEIEGEIVRALYVVRNPDKLRHLQQR